MIKTMKTIEFIKMHGIGNDFVILDSRLQPFENKYDLSKKLGDRHFGVGGDQIIFMEPSTTADVLMRIYNPDGSESGACGNATRCVADILIKEKWALAPKLDTTFECSIETRAGILKCIRVDMGEPRLDWSQIPLSRDCDTLNLPIGGDGVSHPVVVNMGNPHCVFFVDDIERIDITKIGRRFEVDPIFPDRANIEFVEVINKEHVKMRVWERGAGITLGCGSGACASAVAAMRRGVTGRKITVSMDGGDLTIEWSKADNHVYMTGPVAYVFKGQFLLE